MITVQNGKPLALRQLSRVAFTEGGSTFTAYVFKVLRLQNPAMMGGNTPAAGP